MMATEPWAWMALGLSAVGFSIIVLFARAWGHASELHEERFLRFRAEQVAVTLYEAMRELGSAEVDEETRNRVLDYSEALMPDIRGRAHQSLLPPPIWKRDA